MFIRPWPPAFAVVPSSEVLVDTLPNVAGLVKLTTVFGADRLYHLNGFWKSNRNSAVARSLIFHCFEAENWQSMKRCRPKVLRPTFPSVYASGYVNTFIDSIRLFCAAWTKRLVPMSKPRKT